jgi:hypothetical protein
MTPEWLHEHFSQETFRESDAMVFNRLPKFVGICNARNDAIRKNYSTDL